MGSERLADALTWVRQATEDSAAELQPLAGDASFRRYFRVTCADGSRVLMDAAPGKEDLHPFLTVRGWLDDARVRVPDLLGRDISQGFLLLEDFGDITWASALVSGHEPRPLFDDALRQLHALQAHPPAFELPLFDMARMRAECDLYLDWYLPHVAHHHPSDAERDAFHASLSPLLEAVLRLPRVPVHLDYHSRNLMLPQGAVPLGVIDFQDAVSGPVTYDLASLLYDCYQEYSERERRYWSENFFDALPPALRDAFDGFDAWHRALRLTAMQRHIKAIGIFARLAFRDGKRQFLREIPLTRQHLRQEIDDLGMEESVSPLLLMEAA